jgi:hypothetical protein
LLVLPVNNFPDLETANFKDYYLQSIPVDPNRSPHVNEADINQVEGWMTSLGHSIAYVVFSRSMAEYVNFTGLPNGYVQLVNTARSRPAWSVVYRNADVTIYLVHL